MPRLRHQRMTVARHLQSLTCHAVVILATAIADVTVHTICRVFTVQREGAPLPDILMFDFLVFG